MKKVGFSVGQNGKKLPSKSPFYDEKSDHEKLQKKWPKKVTKKVKNPPVLRDHPMHTL